MKRLTGTRVLSIDHPPCQRNGGCEDMGRLWGSSGTSQGCNQGGDPVTHQTSLKRDFNRDIKGLQKRRKRTTHALTPPKSLIGVGQSNH